MENLSDQLSKCKNDRHVYNYLYKIRTKYANNQENIEKLLKRKVVGQLAVLLKERIEIKQQSEENNKIIDVILSILANCTYNNKAASNQVFDANVTEQMMTVIDKSDSPTLIAKVCRLIGNLVYNEQIGMCFQQAGVALSFSNCLSENSVPLLITMCIRAIRLMWNSKKFRLEILSFGVIFKVISCLSNALKSELKNDDEQVKTVTNPVTDNNMVILKRQSGPDRLISKEKLSSILTKMENHQIETNYEILRPENAVQKFSLPSSKDHADLITAILKLLLTMTTTASLITQIARNLYDSNGIPCLIFLVEESSKFRVSCLKILSNLSYSRQSNEFLGVNNELIPSISNLLISTETEMPANERKFCLDILCLSTENSCNRLKLKRSGVFKTLLTIAATTTEQDELNLLIFAFFQYRYDEDSLNLLIKLNLINVLIKIIENIISNMEVDHMKNDDAYLDNNKEEQQKTTVGQKRKKNTNSDMTTCYTNVHNKFMKFDSTSPSSSNSGHGYQYSPSRSSSDGYSPYNSPQRCYQDYNSDSNEYSPVCSDNEDINEKSQKHGTKNDFDILEYIYGNDEIGFKEDKDDVTLNECNSDEENESNKIDSKNSENGPETLKCIKENKLQYILLLLWKLSINHSDALAFVNSSNLSTLIKVFGIVKKPNEKIYQILQNVIEQTRNFVPIFMRQDFVFQLFEESNKSHSHSNCYSCDKMKSTGVQLLKDFRKVAESGYAEGEMVQCLMQTNCDELKQKTAIKLMYVVSSIDILNKFLFNYKVLEIVMDTIIKGDKFLAVAACNGLTILANNLNIRVPLDDEVLDRIIPDDFDPDDDLLNSTNESVKFILKDGEISFDKETLKRSSEVFNSMLSSNFRESNKNEVKFPNYTVLGMKYFFQLIMMSNNQTLKVIAPKINNMDDALQAYELSILYILTKIQQPLLNVIKIILNETNVKQAFEWSIANVNQDLLISSICFYLCGPVDGETKLNLFLDVSKSQFSKEWRELMFDCILIKCRPVDD